MVRASRAEDRNSAVQTAERRWPFMLMRRLLARPAAGAGTIICGLFLLIAVVGPLIAPYGANEQLAAEAGQPPGSQHWFGTDHLGRDVFSRVLLGAGDILSLAGVGTLLALLVGTSLGLITGYLGGWLDEVLMRGFDSLLAMPALLLGLLLLCADCATRL